MIDPSNIVRYDYTDAELEELIIFCICVAGKTADIIAPRVHELIKSRGEYSPLEWLHCIEIEVISKGLANWMKTCGIGCYNQKTQTILDLYNKNLDLKDCSLEDLESIKGIGPKTARFFLMCTRPNVELAALDTHILKFLAANGVENVPKSTPKGKRYKDLEQIFLSMVPKPFTPAEYDLIIWRKYSEGN